MTWSFRRYTRSYSYVISNRSGRDAHPHQIHMDHMAETGRVSQFHCDLAHKPISIKEAVDIAEAEAVVEKNNTTTSRTCRLQESNFRGGRGSTSENTEHPLILASVMDLCHQKHAEFAKDLQRCHWRVVLQEDNVKDDHGFGAVFAEQGASASQMAASKCGRKRKRRSLSVHTSAYVRSSKMAEIANQQETTSIE